MPGSRYSASHANPQGPGDARPTAKQIIADENLIGNLPSKTILITDCSSGIGIETAKALATTGCRLFLTARDLPKAKTVLSDILDPGRVELLEMDMNSLANVRKAATEFKDKSKVLNVLICNAGNSTPEFNSRVVMVSSSGHRNGGILVGDYNFAKEGYGAGRAYGQSKTANVYMANEIERRYGGRCLRANSVMPGGIMTGLQVHFSEEERRMMGQQPVCKSPEQGAATTILAAVGKKWEGVGGKYLEDCEEAPLLGDEWSWLEPGYVAHVFDEEMEKRLWGDSLEMVGLREDD